MVENTLHKTYQTYLLEMSFYVSNLWLVIKVKINGFTLVMTARRR